MMRTKVKVFEYAVLKRATSTTDLETCLLRAHMCHAATEVIAAYRAG